MDAIDRLLEQAREARRDQRLDVAHAGFDKAIVMSRRAGNDMVLARALIGKAQIARDQGRPIAAIPLYEEAVKRLRVRPIPWPWRLPCVISAMPSASTRTMTRPSRATTRPWQSIAPSTTRRPWPWPMRFGPWPCCGKRKASTWLPSRCGRRPWNCMARLASRLAQTSAIATLRPWPAGKPLSKVKALPDKVDATFGYAELRFG